MTHLLLDEMFPLRAAELLREQYGHQAAHVSEFGPDATDDADIAAFARADNWAIVTENVTDFTRESVRPRAVVRPQAQPPRRRGSGSRAR